MANQIKELCLAPSGQTEVLQGNLAFAVGCVRAGIHAADGYPGTPSSEVIDRGLSQVQDLIEVGWSINEAVAAGVGHGHTLTGHDCVVTMKIPGLFQAGDIFTSGAMYTGTRGGLIYYIASDFTPSSTQHTIDPRYLFKCSFVPVFEPRSFQELHESAGIAVEIARKYKTQVVIMPSGVLCHSEGIIHLMPPERRDPVEMPADLHEFNVLPSFARRHYDKIMNERMPQLVEMVESSPLNTWEKSKGKIGVITSGVCDLYVREISQTLGLELDILSLAFTNPLPFNLMHEFCRSIEGEIFAFEDGYRYLQEAVEQLGFPVKGKPLYSPITEWTPAMIAETLGAPQPHKTFPVSPLPRPPALCPGCPYRLFAQEVSLLKKKKKVEAVFGDIGCNTLLYFMNALDTGLAMGASESQRSGYVLSDPERASRCISVLGDSTEAHTGMDATRNAIYRNVPGVKVILDNQWTAMTGGQPSPTSPANLAGQPMKFDLPATLAAHGAKVVETGAYNGKDIRKVLKNALDDAAQGNFTTIVVREGPCLRKSPASAQRVYVDPQACKKCNICLVCPGIELDTSGIPVFNNLCSGCGGHTPACVQSCPYGVLTTVDLADLDLPQPDFAKAPERIEIPELSPESIPPRLSLAIRGVGGQGNLFFGRVLTQLAFLAGYGEQNIVKGDTHGMAQMGGPVISTFACGEVVSPVLLPGMADCLIVMEKSEALRPGFLDLLKPGGTILFSETRILPQGLTAEQYPADEQIAEIMRPYRVISADVLGKAIELGDTSGRIANVVMLGILSTIPPFDIFPAELWLNAIQSTNPKALVWAANHTAFLAGREMSASAVKQ